MDIVTEKKCNFCGETKQFDLFHRGNKCKECHKKYKAAEYQKNKEKILIKCKEYRNKNIDKVRARRKEYYAKTRDESKAKSQKWYYDNQEKVKVWSSQYYKDNTEKKKEYSKWWQKENPDKVKERNKRWEQRNPEKVAERHKRWSLQNPEKRRVISKNSNYKRKRSVSGKFTSDEWIELCGRYDNKCLCCGRQDAVLTVDHVIPISKGGSNIIDNIQPLCLSCNSKKHVKIIDFR